VRQPVNFDSSGFYDAGQLKQVAINLFYGWGYNFYRTENQLRTDDQLIRAKAAWLLGLARAAVDIAEQAYRRERLPPPSRANPYPDPEAVAACQSLERFGAALGALVGRLHALPVPENDRMTQRYRSEASTLRWLADCDETLIGQCELLKTSLEGQTGAWVLENLASLEGGLAAIGKTMEERQGILT
jgi:hypothetical protein